jgi:hypothetical protein
MARVFGIAAIAAVAGAVVAQATSPSAEGVTPGQPLTKEEYFQASVHFGEEEGRSERLYYAFAVKPLTRGKCASLTRRYHRRLTAILAEAKTYVPPPEISDLHASLIATSDQIVRGVGRIARHARAGKVSCGDELGGSPEANAADKVYRLFSRSRFDEILKQLADLGYIPSGE